jgi:hypothetical protein
MTIQDIYEKWFEAVESARKSVDGKKDEIKPEDLPGMEGIVVRSGIKAGDGPFIFAKPKEDDFQPWQIHHGDTMY